jgi:hypothetical protein
LIDRAEKGTFCSDWRLELQQVLPQVGHWPTLREGLKAPLRNRRSRWQVSELEKWSRVMHGGRHRVHVPFIENKIGRVGVIAGERSVASALGLHEKLTHGWRVVGGIAEQVPAH